LSTGHNPSTASDLKAQKRADLRLARRILEDGVAAAAAAVSRRQKEFAAPTGPFAREARKVAGDVNVESFSPSQDAGGRCILFALKEEVLSSAAEAVRRACTEWGTRELGRIRDDLGRAVGGALSASGADPGAAAADLRAELGPAALRIHVPQPQQLEYRVKTWFDRFTFARTPVFLLLMGITWLANLMGSDRRLVQVLAPLIGGCFLAMVLWSFPRFEDERRDFLERELRRLRRSIEGDLVRSGENFVSEWAEQVIQEVRRTETLARRVLDDADYSYWD